MNQKMKYNPPKWATSYIGSNDATFITELIKTQKPKEIIEIGVASGFSSIILLESLDRYVDKGHLHSFDILEKCHFNNSYPIGFAVEELAPHLKQYWSLHTKSTGFDAGKLLNGRDINFLFIDGNHFHPWPTLDLLALIPAISNNSHIILHDISENWAHTTNIYGPMHIFNLWPYEKKSQNNIGYITISDKNKLKSFCYEILNLNWDNHVDPYYLKKLESIEIKVHDKKMEKFVKKIQDIMTYSNRDIFIWGAGNHGMTTQQIFNLNGIVVSGFIDSDEKKTKTSDNIQVKQPCMIDEIPNKPLIIISSMYFKEIERYLLEIGYIKHIDYFIVHEIYSS